MAQTGHWARLWRQARSLIVQFSSPSSLAYQRFQVLSLGRGPLNLTAARPGTSVVTTGCQCDLGCD